MQMNITTDYAIRFLLCLGNENRVVSGGEIARRMVIPPKYLLKIARKLREAGVIGTISGIRGGYYLKKSLDELSLLEVMKVMEPTMAIKRCLESDGYCSRGEIISCPIRKYYMRMWQEMEEKWLSRTLAEIMAMSGEESYGELRAEPVV